MSETPENLTNEGVPAVPDGGARPGISDGAGNHPAPPSPAPAAPEPEHVAE